MKRSQSMSQQIAEKANMSDIMSLNHVFQQHQQSPIASNASTPTTAHPYAPLQSPTFSMTNNTRWVNNLSHVCDKITAFANCLVTHFIHFQRQQSVCGTEWHIFRSRWHFSCSADKCIDHKTLTSNADVNCHSKASIASLRSNPCWP